MRALPLDGRFPLSGSPPEGVVGRGLNEDDALVACLAEGCERYSAFYQGNEPTMLASCRSLGAGAVHPQDLLHFSKRQFLSREEHTDVDEFFIPVPFDEDMAIDWVEARSLTEESRLLPAAYCYLRHMEPSHPFCVADSSGCAAGVDRDSAVERGLLELIERDAAAIWWYNQLPARGLPFDVFSNEIIVGFPD